MDTVRRVVSFGVTLGYADCARADVILGKMRFQMPKIRTVKLTLEYVRKIRSVAHGQGLGSIALAQTLQFELAMRQKDVIGEWVLLEGDAGGITHKNTRWTGGLVWSDIDVNMILRKTHVKTGIPVEHDLSLYPDILHEIDLVDPSRRVGPMIISEATGEPYKPGRSPRLGAGLPMPPSCRRASGIWIRALAQSQRPRTRAPTRPR